MLDRRLHERASVAFRVRVTSVSKPELSAIGEALDISKSGMGVNLPVQFAPGCLVQLEIADSSMHGFVAYARRWPQPSEEPFARNKVWVDAPDSVTGYAANSIVFQTGIEVVDALIGVSGLSQLLKATLEQTMPHLRLADAEKVS